MSNTCCETVCETSEKGEPLVCPSCGKKGKRVKTRTLHYLLKGKFQKDVVPPSCGMADAMGVKLQKEAGPDLIYYFCGMPDCDVVYYSSNSRLFKKEQIRVPVGQKEKINPQVCYCFNFFESDLREEIEAASKTTIPDFIRQKVKEKACACEIMNPQGSCCLGNVSQAVKKIENESQEAPPRRNFKNLIDSILGYRAMVA